MTDIYILGGYQTDFARNWTREGKTPEDMIQECVYAGLKQAQLDADRVETCHIGNFAGELFLGQGMLGGIVAEAIPEFRGLPSNRHEAACASGSMAVLSAIADIKAGFYDVACVLGMEWMRNTDGKTAAGHLASAAWAGHEAQNSDYCWPHMFSNLHEVYEQRYGIDKKHLHAISKNNYANAKNNPNAQGRGWQFEEQAFACNDELNPTIDGHTRKLDCSQITDGAACIFLASKAFAEEHAKQCGYALESIPRIKGWGHTTSRISFDAKVADSQNEQLIFPHVNKAITDALGRAGLQDVWGVDGIETHDCFTVSEYMAIEHFGITAPGKAGEAIDGGWIAMGNKLPVNASGGLIGCGHPVGATGVRMILDGYKQTTNQAGSYQIEGAKNIATLNIGGTTTAVASFVVGVD